MVKVLLINFVLEFFILIALEKIRGLFAFLNLKFLSFKKTFESVPMISFFFHQYKSVKNCKNYLIYLLLLYFQ